MEQTEQPEFNLLYNVHDIPRLIFTWLDPTSRAAASTVCKRWHAIIESLPIRAYLSPACVDDPGLLDWALKGCKPPGAMQKILCKVAATNGKHKSFQLLMKFGANLDARECALAASRCGSVQILEQIEAERQIRLVYHCYPPSQLPWAGECCLAAAGEGHLEVLRHFIKDTWPCYASPGLRIAASAKAFMRGNHDIALWLNDPTRPNMEEVD